MCNHIFQAVQGSSPVGSVLSYHGKCKECKIEMTAYVKLDDSNNGEMIISAADGYKEKKNIKNGNIRS